MRTPMKPLHILAVAVIVLLGAFLRLYQLDLTKFTADEVIAFDLAFAWLDNGRFPLLGVESFTTGVNRPAVMSYLLVPVFLISRDPVVATAFMALLNILSVPLAYRLVSAHFGPRAALLASLLYAASFWAVYSSRHAWDIAPLTPFAVLVLDRLLAAACRRNPAAFGWALSAAIIAVAVHPAGMGLVLLALTVGVVARPPVRRGLLVTALLLAALVWTPYFWHLATSDWHDVMQALRLGTRPIRLDLDIAAVALWQLFPHPRDPLLQAQGGTVVPAGDWLELVHPVLVGAFLVSVAWCTARGLRTRRHERAGADPYLVVALSYLVPLALLIPHPFPIYDRYTFLLLPSASIILALGLLASGRALRMVVPRTLAWANPLSLAWTWGAALTLAGVQSYTLLAFLHWLSGQGSTFASGVPLRFTLRAIEAATAARLSPADPVNIAARRDNEEVYRYLARALPATVLNQDGTLLFPSAASRRNVYLTIADESEVARLLRERFPEAEQFNLLRTYAIMKGFSGVAIGTSFPPAEQVDLLRASPPDYYRVFVLPPGSGQLAQTAATHTRGPWKLASGLVLEGFSLGDEVPRGQDLVLTLAWTVEDRALGAGSNPRFFAHLLDGKGRKWGEANEIEYSQEHWRPGDRVISWLRIPVETEAPQGLYSLSFGMFDADSQERFSITASGRTTDALVTGPLRLGAALPLATPQHSLEPPARFGEHLELLGYDLPGDVEAGAEVNLRLVWRAVQPLLSDYTLFAHLLDGSGSLVAQDDGFPSDGIYPTSAWPAGELVEDRRRLSVPDSLAGHRMAISVGWYLLESGERLRLTSTAGGEDALLIGPVVVRR